MLHRLFWQLLLHAKLVSILHNWSQLQRISVNGRRPMLQLERSIMIITSSSIKCSTGLISSGIQTKSHGTKSSIRKILKMVKWISNDSEISMMILFHYGIMVCKFLMLDKVKLQAKETGTSPEYQLLHHLQNISWDYFNLKIAIWFMA